MQLGVGIYKVVVKFEQVKKELKKVSTELEKSFRRTTSARFGCNGWLDWKPLVDGMHEDIDSSQAEDVGI